MGEVVGALVGAALALGLPRPPVTASPVTGDRRLELRPKSVRNYVSNVLTKLQAADRAAAVSGPREAGLGRG